MYSPESELSYDLFAIMDKLELIGSMGSYYDAYRLLRTQPLSGRYVLEELTVLTAASPKMRKEQRLKQLDEYRAYTYMRKRWEKYLRNHGLAEVPWEDAINLILVFVSPIWESLCRNEIFFDDWMPELGRFLGIGRKYAGTKLNELEQSDIYPFHMPGHKRAFLPFANPYAIDITEIEGFDNLHHATGILQEAQQKAADLYGAKKTYYLVNGSTCGLLAAISAAVPRGEKILMARNCHKAVYHAMYLRQLVPVYLYPEDTAYGIQGQVTPQMVQKQLKQTPDIRAVVITSPTYDGVVSDIKNIADTVHAYGIPLIVDEAHGAHFGFSPEFPENATRLGADAVIMSVHKTLPAFTQTALLHLCSDRIAEKKVAQFLGIYETSSPSYLLMAGIEKSLQIIEKDRENAVCCIQQEACRVSG